MESKHIKAEWMSERVSERNGQLHNHTEGF